MSKPLALWPYQKKQVDAVVRDLRHGLSTILQSPVGTGKTRMGTAVVRQLLRRTLWLAHTRELVAQAKEALDAMGCRNVDVDTVQRVHFHGAPGGYGLIVIDECHRTMGGGEDGMYRQVLRANPEAPVLGLTATPMRADGKPLLKRNGGVYDSLVLGKPVDWHCRQGNILRPLHYTSPERIDQLSIRRIAHTGDYNMQSAAKQMVHPKLCGDVVDHYVRLAKGRKAAVFACNLQHAEALQKRFARAVGKKQVRIVSSRNGLTERAQIFADFRAGKFTVLLNVNIITEGWDYPALGVAVIARPTRSRTLYVQMVGRIMRQCPGKPTPLVLDHGGVFHEHGQVSDDFDWVEGQPHSPAQVTCPTCGCVNAVRRDACQACGESLALPTKEMRSRHRRRSSVEESKHRLQLVEAEARVRRRTDRLHAVRQRDPAWVPMPSNKLTDETQQAVYALWLTARGYGRNHRGPSVKDVAAHFGIAAVTVQAIVSMEVRAKIKARQEAYYEKNKRAIMERQRAWVRANTPDRPPLNAQRNLDDGWMPTKSRVLDAQVQTQMRRMWETQDISVEAIAKRFGVSIKTATCIVSMERRAHFARLGREAYLKKKEKDLAQRA